MKDKNKRKQILFSVLGILSILVITIGVTYAVFTYTKEGTTDNVVTSGTLKFLYTENNTNGNGISITEAEPISDTKGKELVGDNNVFDFKVEGTNTGSEVIPYEVTLRKKATSTMGEDNIKVYLQDGIDQTELLTPTLYSKLVQTTTDVGNNVEKSIYKGEVAGNTNNYLKTFRLKMWLDENADLSVIGGQTFTATVNVYSNAKVISEEEQALRSNTDIKNITIGDTSLTKVENKDWNYEVELDSDTTAKLNIVPKYSLANIKIEKDNQVISNNSEVSLVGGNNIYKVTITSTDQTVTKEYKINLKVKQAEKVSIFGKQYEVIDAEPTLTTSSNNTSDESGLYKSTATNTGEPTYYFRGNVENNYVSFAGQTWRIVRINEDGTIRIVMQDVINNTSYRFNSNYNNYTYMYYTNNSNAKTTLESWYQTNIGSKADLVKNVASGSYYCEQAKVKYDDSYTSGSATMTTYNKYTPDFKCSSDGNGKGIVNASIGLLNYDEVVYAGGYFNQGNNNYYLYNNITFWTMSPFGFASPSSRVCRVRTTGGIEFENASSTNRLRPVLNLDANTQISDGDGTKNNPFVVE